MFINRNEVLIVLHFYQITGFGCIGTQNNRTIQRSKYTFIGIGGYICSVMLLLCIKVSRNHTTCRTIKNQSVHIRLRSNRGKVVLLCLLILAAEFLFTFGTFHQRILTQSSQRIHTLYGVNTDFSAKDILNIHNIQILPFYQLLQRIHT